MFKEPRRRLPAGLALLALTAPNAALAQQDEERDPLSGRATLGFLATSGNTESTNANARLRLAFVPNAWSHEWDLSAIGATRDKETTAEAYNGLYVARRSFGQNYIFTALDWNKNRFSAYPRQRSETVGYGRQLLDGETQKLSMEAGLGARYAKRIDGPSQEEGIARGSLDYEWTMNSTTSFTQDVIVESGSSNTSVETVSALRARLIGDVALVVSFRLRRNSTVPVESVKTDTFSSISLEYAF
jgi:putative salt-induced outer membrane protein